MERKRSGFPRKRGKPADTKSGTPPEGGVPIIFTADFVGSYILETLQNRQLFYSFSICIYGRSSYRPSENVYPLSVRRWVSSFQGI